MVCIFSSECVHVCVRICMHACVKESVCVCTWISSVISEAWCAINEAWCALKYDLLSVKWSCALGEAVMYSKWSKCSLMKHVLLMKQACALSEARTCFQWSILSWWIMCSQWSRMCAQWSKDILSVKHPLTMNHVLSVKQDVCSVKQGHAFNEACSHDESCSQWSRICAQWRKDMLSVNHALSIKQDVCSVKQGHAFSESCSLSEARYAVFKAWWDFCEALMCYEWHGNAVFVKQWCVFSETYYALSQDWGAHNEAVVCSSLCEAWGVLPVKW